MLHYLHARRTELGISSIVASGDSGGGNLCLALALKVKKEGKLDSLDGVFAQSPFIYSAHGHESRYPAELASLRSCEAGWVTGTFMDAIAWSLCEFCEEKSGAEREGGGEGEGDGEHNRATLL